MTVVAVVVTTLLAGGAVLALVRIVRGPSILDRIVATDVLLATIVMAIAAEAAFSRDATALPVLAVLSILGFTGAVSVARFAIRRQSVADPASGRDADRPSSQYQADSVDLPDSLGLPAALDRRAPEPPDRGDSLSPPAVADRPTEEVR
ncbi:monovalent cation/H+ antiporter complex subunit F [Paractinoplanes pyxinae]|uniref:monovalent cation/H+ antiporter complex subunit F n=1 Tax=Paractinoplanes pyxinae TaxID=2997416 RepID=UPI002D1E371F|nr:monovalent cation/H+ antiporter complex subunit F [Actinoplanes pyxinae]